MKAGFCSEVRERVFQQKLVQIRFLCVCPASRDTAHWTATRLVLPFCIWRTQEGKHWKRSVCNIVQPSLSVYKCLSHVSFFPLHQDASLLKTRKHLRMCGENLHWAGDLVLSRALLSCPLPVASGACTVAPQHRVLEIVTCVLCLYPWPSRQPSEARPREEKPTMWLKFPLAGVRPDVCCGQGQPE